MATAAVSAVASDKTIDKSVKFTPPSSIPIGGMMISETREVRGLPNMIRVDNGPEFISHRLDAWCKDHKITLAFIQPGKPTQNAYVERFNGSIRRELLNAYVFRTLDEVKEKAFQWQEDYNHHRPHKSLGYRAPIDVVP